MALLIQAEYLVPEASGFLKALNDLRLLTTKFDQVDINLWNIPAISNLSPTHLLTYLLSKYTDYVYKRYIDGILLSALYKDFEGWDKTTFIKILSEFKRVLKTTLREEGVYTGKINGEINK
jgi:hypothetical protein